MAVDERDFSIMSLSYVDSKAMFKQRCQESSIPSAVVTKLVDKGWSTLALFAHAPKVIPGQSGYEKALQDMIDALLGDDEKSHEAGLRRLHWEAWTFTAADLKKKIEGPEEASRKLPTAEIGARLDALAPKLAPLKLRGVLEPSYAAIQIFAGMREDGRLRYVEWCKLTTRTQEVYSTSEDAALKSWKPDKQGIIREVPPGPGHDLKANVATDLDIQNALRRRGVCYAITELMSFEVHETVVSWLFEAYQRDPPEGFSRVTLAQIAACDREIHLAMSEASREGFSLGSDGSLPLDRHVPKVLSQQSVQQIILPRAGAARASIKPGQKRKRSSSRNQSQPPAKAAKGQSKGKSKDKNRDSGKSIRTPYMPAALRGGVPRNHKGLRLCWNYNLRKCRHEGTSCENGEHECCFPGCFERHAFLDHPSS